MPLLPHRHFLDLGYALVVPIMPADGTAAPTSTLSIGNRGAGKVPGVRGDDGLWRGHREWTTRVSTPVDLDLYTAMGASVGIRTGLQPDGNSLVAIDADATEALAAALVRNAIEGRFGKLPCRVGRAPKALFFVRVRGPFRYRRVEYGAAKPYDRVELLSDNRQAVVEGLHPKTMRPYTWTTPLCRYEDLPLVDPTDLEALMADLESVLPNVQRSKVDGDAGSAPPQEALRGELRHVRGAMRVLPNTTALFPDRESYLNVGYALKAALPDDREEGLALYLEWCARWASGDTGEVNDLDIAEADWRRMTGPFRLGASWIFDQAERHSAGAWSKAALHFEQPATVTDEPLFGFGDGTPEIRPLRIIDPTQYQGVAIPPRRWLIRDWAPWGYVTGLYGEGGLGKSLVAQQLQTAAAVGKSWLGLETAPVRSLGFYCEDSEEELWRRQADIDRLYGCDFGDLGAACWMSRLGDENLLIKFSTRTGAGELTPLHGQIIEAARDHRAELVVVDTVSDTFGGNENDRGQVRAYVSWCLGTIAREIGGSVLCLAHPSRAGIASGSGDGGSTGWSAAFRSRLSLQMPRTEKGDVADPDARELTRKKANYAAREDAIPLRWRAGALVVDAPAGEDRRPQRPCAEVFLDLLDLMMKLDRPVSDSSRAGNYAPKMFATHPGSERYQPADFQRAMERLFGGGEIRLETYGRKSDRRQRIVRTAGATVEAAA